MSAVENNTRSGGIKDTIDMMELCLFYAAIQYE